MEVICLQDDAFFNLVDRVIKHIDSKIGSTEDEWISGQQVMDLLGVKSKTTLQGLRDQGEIEFSQPKRKVILYSKKSALEYLDKHRK